MAGAPGLGQAALAAGAVAGAGIGVFGERSRQRRRLADRVVEGVADTLDAPYLDRGMVRLQRWTQGWPGRPQRIRLYYQAASQDLAPDWQAMVLDLLMRRLMTQYRIVEHDQLACLLVLEIDTSVDALTEVPPVQVRAVAALSRQIDKSVGVLDVEFNDDGTLRAITVNHNAGDKMAAAGSQARVERIFEAMHPGRWRAKWDTETDVVRLEQRPTLDDSIWVEPASPVDIEDLLANYDAVAIGYAKDEDGEEIVWRPARVPHMLLTGETGSGKTSTMYAVVGNITAFGWPVWIVDGKGVEFLGHRTWPNVQVVATNVEQQIAVIHRAHMLMEERYRLIEHEGFDTSDFEPLVVVIDELAEFIGELYDWYGSIRTTSDPRQPPVMRLLQSLLRKARTARIHLVISTQRPDVQLMGQAGGEMRSNIGQRCSIGRLDPQGAMMMWNNPKMGITLPRGVRQRAITVNAEGQAVEAQCYRFPSMKADPDSEEGRLLAQMRPDKSRYPRLLVLPAEVNEINLIQDKKNKNPDQLLFYRDYALAKWDRADARPDLDPVVQGQRKRTREEARRLTSTMSVLDLDTNELTRTPGTLGDVTPETERDNEVPVDEYGVPIDLDDYTGYDQPTPMLPFDLEIGDLIQVDDAVGWAVVDEDPAEDGLDPDQVAISWRDDQDQFGSVSLDATTHLLVRRPSGFVEESP